MATKKRRPFIPKRAVNSRAELYFEFMRDLLSGAISAETVIESTQNGQTALDYDEPEGPQAKPVPRP